MLKSEFANKICTIFGEGSPWREISATFPEYNAKEGTIQIRVAQEYEHVELTMNCLDQLAALTETKDINIGDKDSYGGCDTCDWGSSYWVDLHLKNFRLPLEEDPASEKKKR